MSLTANPSDSVALRALLNTRPLTILALDLDVSSGSGVTNDLPSSPAHRADLLTGTPTSAAWILHRTLRENIVAFIQAP